MCPYTFKIFKKSKGPGPAPGPLWLLVVPHVLATGQCVHTDRLLKVRGHAHGTK